MHAEAQLMQILTAKWAPPVIGVLARLRIADHLADGPQSPEELARLTGAHPRSLYRLLRAAASLDVFAEDEHGRFRLTDMAACLRSDAPGSLRAAAVMFGLEPFWSPYARLLHSATTGEPAFDQLYGVSIYDYLAQHSEDAQIFGAAAAAFHAAGIRDIVAAYDFSPYPVVVDLGGGNGALLVELLQAYPDIRGVLFEQPQVLPGAVEVLEAAELTSRIDLVAGDFFAAVPAGDAFVIKSCLHNFADERVIEALQVIRWALPPGAPLLVAETVVPAGNAPHYSKFDDIEMLAIAGGADRSEREWVELLAAAGLRHARTIPCGERFSLLEAFANE